LIDLELAQMACILWVKMSRFSTNDVLFIVLHLLLAFADLFDDLGTLAQAVEEDKHQDHNQHCTGGHHTDD